MPPSCMLSLNWVHCRNLSSEMGKKESARRRWTTQSLYAYHRKGMGDVKDLRDLSEQCLGLAANKIVPAKAGTR